MKNNNNGFTLVELVVVLAILAIMSVGAVVGFGYLGMANASKCATKIDSGITVLRSKNMSQASSTYMHLYKYSGDYYIAYSDAATYTPDDKGERIANNKITVSFDTDPIEEGEDVCLGIRKKDGSFTTTLNPTSKIVVSGQSSYTITLVTTTGKHFKE